MSIPRAKLTDDFTFFRSIVSGETQDLGQIASIIDQEITDTSTLMEQYVLPGEGFFLEAGYFDVVYCLFLLSNSEKCIFDSLLDYADSLCLVSAAVVDSDIIVVVGLYQASVVVLHRRSCFKHPDKSNLANFLRELSAIDRLEICVTSIETIRIIKEELGIQLDVETRRIYDIRNRFSCLRSYFQKHEMLNELFRYDVPCVSLSNSLCLPDPQISMYDMIGCMFVNLFSYILESRFVGFEPDLELMFDLKEFLPKQDAVVSSSHFVSRTYRLTECFSKEDFTECGRLGAGGFGQVALVFHNVLYQFFALKCAYSSRYAENLQNEYNLLVKCQHPCIVHAYGYVPLAYGLRIVLEFCRYGQLPYSGVVPEEYVSPAMCDVMFALDYLHCLGYIHGDIKEGNILIGHGFYGKVSDLGSCRFANETTTSDFHQNTTRMFARIGKLDEFERQTDDVPMLLNLACLESGGLIYLPFYLDGLMTSALFKRLLPVEVRDNIEISNLSVMNVANFLRAFQNQFWSLSNLEAIEMYLDIRDDMLRTKKWSIENPRAGDSILSLTKSCIERVIRFVTSWILSFEVEDFGEMRCAQTEELVAIVQMFQDTLFSDVVVIPDPNTIIAAMRALDPILPCWSPLLAQLFLKGRYVKRNLELAWYHATRAADFDNRHYILAGRVAEKMGDIDGALDSYKACAERVKGKDRQQAMYRFTKLYIQMLTMDERLQMVFELGDRRLMWETAVYYLKDLQHQVHSGTCSPYDAAVRAKETLSPWFDILQRGADKDDPRCLIHCWDAMQILTDLGFPEPPLHGLRRAIKEVANFCDALDNCLTFIECRMLPGFKQFRQWARARNLVDTN